MKSWASGMQISWSVYSVSYNDGSMKPPDRSMQISSCMDIKKFHAYHCADSDGPDQSAHVQTGQCHHYLHTLKLLLTWYGPYCIKLSKYLDSHYAISYLTQENLHNYGPSRPWAFMQWCQSIIRHYLYLVQDKRGIQQINIYVLFISPSQKWSGNSYNP